MRRLCRALGIGAAIALSGASVVVAQDLQEMCPDIGDGQGALVGVLSDPDAEMGLPGATVRATWSNGESGRAEAQTGIDGSFVLCYLPLETEISVVGAFASMVGQPMALTLTDPVTEHDMSFSMTGASATAESGDDRIWACIGGGESQENLQFSRIIRCEAHWEPLENCPKRELGSVSASPLGDGAGRVRDMLERLTAEARRLGANALIDIREERSGARSEDPVENLKGIRATAVRIDVDPATCI